MTLRIAPRYFRDVDDVELFLAVEVDDAACGSPPPQEIKERLEQLKRDGIRLTLTQILGAAAVLYEASGTTSESNIQQTWGTLEQWTFSASKGSMVATPPGNEALQRQGSEALGVGVGLLVAEHLYDLPLRFWQRTVNNAVLDYLGTRRKTGETIALDAIGLEVRARLDRNNWGEAVGKAAGKLNKVAARDLVERNFASAAAILFAPRSQPLERAAKVKDILIMDPVNPKYTHPTEAGVASLRALLRHYAPFFLQQEGYAGEWGRHLLELADGDEETFSRYLRGGDTRLQYDRRGVKKPWRTFFRYDGQRFCGTAFEGDRWPAELGSVLPQQGKGFFYWGLSEQIIEALRDGQLKEIAHMEISPGETYHQGKVFVLLSDGVALAWAPSETTLNPDLFADLPDGDEAVPARAREAGKLMKVS